MDITIKLCKKADEEHAESKRQYAHTFHKEKVICVARAFFKLPEDFQQGIIIHEIGHLFGAETEKGADRIGKNAVGIGVQIERVNSKAFGRNLQRAEFPTYMIQRWINDRQFTV